MKKIGIGALAVVVLVAGGLVANSLVGSEPGPTTSTQSTVQAVVDELDGTTSTTQSPPQDAVATKDAVVTEDAEASSCGCEGGQFAANVSAGAQCAANGFCQSPVDCQSWDSYAADQLGEGPWPSGSSINPDESCGLGCQWTLSCSR